jgi:triacylglycerol lipase
MTYPIVLARGVCRFDVFWSDFLQTDNSDDEQTDMLNYFRGIRWMLKSKGYQVFHSKVSWAAGVDTRAEELKSNILDILKNTSREKVNIIAHSMGGLDARHMMFNDRDKGQIHKRIGSLTTISTPHSGSPFVDWGLKHVPDLVPLARPLGLDLTALSDLTVAKCTAFNNDPEVRRFEQDCVKNEGIRFRTYAGSQNFPAVLDLLKVPFYIIEQEEGENDGLVSVKSAKWDESYFAYDESLKETDHLNELGWWDPAHAFVLESDAGLLKRIHGFYADVAAKLP